MWKISILMIGILGLLIFGVTSPNKRKRCVVEPCDRRLGIRFASDSLIRLYENEHKLMHMNDDGSRDEAEYTEWHLKLRGKNLTEYCKKYLKTIVPRRRIHSMFGCVATGRIVYLYQSDNDGHFSIGVISCETSVRGAIKRGKLYYITEAPEKECVYSLMHTTNRNSPFKIISKVCGFESCNALNTFYYNNQPLDKVKIQRRSGLPIAPRDLIVEYEYKHQVMYKKNDGSTDAGKYKDWPRNQNETYLTEFCAKYLHTIVPKRIKQKNLLGGKDLFELEYTKNNLTSLEIGIIKCHVLPAKGMKINPHYYYITESPDPDCVYSLLRQSHALICKIIGQVCNMKIDDDTREWVNKPDLNTLENLYSSNPPSDGTKDWEMKPDLKTIHLLPRD